MQTSYVTDLDQCEQLWKTLIRPKCVSDLWEFRLCLHNQFQYQPCFIVLEDRGAVAAMLPLSYVDDIDMFVFFPGEMWANKTWLERTPYYCRDRRSFDILLASCPERTFLRYLKVPQEFMSPRLTPDEFGYVLYPSDLDCDLSQYWKRFSRKKFKSIRRTIQGFDDRDCSFHINRISDFSRLVELSLQQYGVQSFLHDLRFREGFREITHLLHRRKMLRMVSIEIDGTIAAVDLGALFRGTYSVFVGGTHQSFPGIAKLINRHHIEVSCKERLRKVDFLCGDFHWKKLWHLDAEPLFKFVSPDLITHEMIIGSDVSLPISPMHASLNAFH